MSYEEKGTWVYLVTSAGAYVVYLVIIGGRVRAVGGGRFGAEAGRLPAGTIAAA